MIDEKIDNLKTEADVRALLAEIAKPEFIDKWMNSSIKYFDNKKPVDVIKDGQINRIKVMFYYLFSGVFS